MPLIKTLLLSEGQNKSEIRFYMGRIQFLLYDQVGRANKIVEGSVHVLCDQPLYMKHQTCEIWAKPFVSVSMQTHFPSILVLKTKIS